MNATVQQIRELRFSDPDRALGIAVELARQGIPEAMVLGAMIILDGPDNGGLLKDAGEWLDIAGSSGEWIPPWLPVALTRQTKHQALSEPDVINEVLDELGLQPWREAIMAAALPSTRLVARREDRDLPVGAQKFGGEPDLVTGEWPSADGAPLAFVGQLRRGRDILGFFYDAEHQPRGLLQGQVPGWSVTVTPEASAKRRSTPAGVTRFGVCSLESRAETTFPPARSRDARDLVAKTPGLELETYSELATLWPARPPVRDGRVHRTGGHPDAIQGDMTRRIEAELRGEDLCGKTSTQLERASREWRLLLQVDSEAQCGMQWGGDGRLYFWIRDIDLTSRRYDDVHVQLQTS